MQGVARLSSRLDWVNMIETSSISDAALVGEQLPYFHAETDSVRFWVPIGEQIVGACVSRNTLFHSYRQGALSADPLESHRAHIAELETAVRNRVATGSREPVMLREVDLQRVADQAAAATLGASS